MTLAEKMAEWGTLKATADELEEQIKTEVMALEKTQKHGAVVATYSKGRGAYLYEDMAMALHPSPETIRRHVKEATNWRELCDEIVSSDEHRARFFTPGKPTVSVKLKNNP